MPRKINHEIKSVEAKEEKDEGELGGSWTHEHRAIVSRASSTEVLRGTARNFTRNYTEE